MAVQTVGVVGTGVIGASWIGLFLSRGLKVLVSDPGPGAEEKLATHLKGIWPDLEKIGLTPGASLENYKFVGASLKGYYDQVEFIQENAPERLDLKLKLFEELDAETKPDVVIASSSSGIPSSKFIAKCAKNPGRVLIGHPFNPPHLMPLVEVVPHPDTAATSVEAAMAFYRSLARSPVLIKQETPGFAANRLQAALCNEAYSLVARGVMSAQDLDTCVTASLGPRWAITGPFMANAMGGGGGVDGFRHLLEHLGPASQMWLDDMKANQFTFTTENLDALTVSVSDELKGKDVPELERRRDGLLVKYVQLRQEYQQLYGET